MSDAIKVPATDTREHLAAILPCGCVVIIATTYSPARQAGGHTFSEYRAAPAALAEFYTAVAKYTSRKRKPLKLEVVALRGKPDLPWSCSVCRPAETMFEKEGKTDGE